MSTGRQELNAKSFNSNYKILKDTADWLSSQKEPDIDQLVPRVEVAMQAYRICKERLDAVEQTLGQYLGESGDPVSDGRPASAGSNGDDDDDIAF